MHLGEAAVEAEIAGCGPSLHIPRHGNIPGVAGIADTEHHRAGAARLGRPRSAAHPDPLHGSSLTGRARGTAYRGWRGKSGQTDDARDLTVLVPGDRTRQRPVGSRRPRLRGHDRALPFRPYFRRCPASARKLGFGAAISASVDKDPARLGPGCSFAPRQ
jgi:hypothetical protein